MRNLNKTGRLFLKRKINLFLYFLKNTREEKNLLKKGKRKQ